MQSFDRRCEAQRPGPFCEILSGGDHHDVRQGARDGSIDAADAGMAVRRADEACLKRARDGQVVDVARRTSEESAVLAPAHRTADRPGSRDRFVIAHCPVCSGPAVMLKHRPGNPAQATSRPTAARIYRDPDLPRECRRDTRSRRGRSANRRGIHRTRQPILRQVEQFVAADQRDVAAARMMHVPRLA